jgi:NADPH-dependent curcumin reductase
LKRACPNGIDVDFENVGGDILNAVLERINVGTRLAICGLISRYNAQGPVPGPANFGNVLLKRARIQGFIVRDYALRFPEAAAQITQWLKEGKLKYRTDVVDGLRNAPTALNKLFDGTNTGKLLVKVSEEPVVT